MEEKVYTAGTVVFREGDLASSFFQILSGTAGVYLGYGGADERKLTEMNPGQFFGEMAIIEAWPRSSTIVAEGELRVLEIPGDDLNTYFTEQPDKILALMKQLSARIRSLTEDYNEVAAFLRQKEEAEEKKPEGFLALLKKWKQVVASSKGSAPAQSEESLLKIKHYGKSRNTNLPTCTFNHGQIIFREGEVGAFMYNIQTGSVSIYSNYQTPKEKKLTTLYANTFFGEMGLIDSEKRSATAIVEEDNTFLEIIRSEDLEGLFTTNPALVDSILVHLSNRLRNLTHEYVRACEKAVADT